MRGKLLPCFVLPVNLFSNSFPSVPENKRNIYDRYGKEGLSGGGGGGGGGGTERIFQIAEYMFVSWTSLMRFKQILTWK